MYGIKLRQLRRQLGLTQRQLGTLCGVGGTTISMIEHGKRLPGRETLRRLQAVLGDLPPRPPEPLPCRRLRRGAEKPHRGNPMELCRKPIFIPAGHHWRRAAAG